MKYLIFSDLHGSYWALKKLEKIISKQKIVRIISLGDILYHGPRNDLPKEYNPKKIIEDIKPYQNKMIFIKGNCDAEVDEMVLNCKMSKMKKIKIGEHIIYLTHGHHLSRFEPDEKLEKGSIVLYGHYHTFNISKIKEVTYINIGSASLPKDQYYQYAIMDEIGIKVYSLSDNTLIGKYDFKEELCGNK